MMPVPSSMRPPRVVGLAGTGAMQSSYLLHDARFALGEGNVPTRFVLDEFDVNLPSLPTGLVVVIVVIVGGGTDARSFDAAVFPPLCAVTVAGRNRVVVDGWRLGRIGKVGHVCVDNESGRCDELGLGWIGDGIEPNEE